MRTSRVLERVTRGGLCAGCGGCTVAAPSKIAMAVDAEGFLRPQQSAPLSGDEERAVQRICPGLTLRQRADGREDHVLWGPIIAVRKGHSTDPKLRRHASSGGILSALLVHLLETGAVGRVVQTAAAPEFPIGNTTLETRSPAQVFEAAGSRYAPSAPLEGLETLLHSPEPAAFVGKPCDVAALRALASGDARIAQRFPVLISFFCAGVPSLAGAREVLRALGVAEAEVASFRYRGDGWPGAAVATREDGTRASMSYAQSWGEILSRHVQLRCKLCPDGTGGFADVVCADAWHCDARGYPLFDEEDGVSLVMTRTARGEALVNEAVASGRIVVEPIDADEVARMQPGQLKRKRAVFARLAALAALCRPRPTFEGFNLVDAARQDPLSTNLRNMLGTMRRLALNGPGR